MEQAFNKPYPSMEYKCTTTKEIEQIIKLIKTKNSYEYDEISTKIVKESCPFISAPINYICNKMLFCGVFPDRLKYAVIKPIHKYDDRCEVFKYRPVSLLTPYSIVGHIWHNLIFFTFEGLLIFVTLLYILVKWFVS